MLKVSSKALIFGANVNDKPEPFIEDPNWRYVIVWANGKWLIAYENGEIKNAPANEWDLFNEWVACQSLLPFSKPPFLINIE